ncbi:MAG: hypothetical protein ACREHD_04710, partial [Pirellulales bacterium]
PSTEQIKAIAFDAARQSGRFCPTPFLDRHSRRVRFKSAFFWRSKLRFSSSNLPARRSILGGRKGTFYFLIA